MTAVSCTAICYKETVLHVLCIYVVFPFIFQESTFQVVLVSGKNMSFVLMHYGHIASTHAAKVSSLKNKSKYII